MRGRTALLQLLACAAAVALSAWLYDLTTGADIGSWPDWRPLELGLEAVTCWLAVAVSGDSDRDLRSCLDLFFTGAGLTLLVQSGLVYLFNLDLLPWAIVLSGSGLAAVFSTVLAERDAGREGILLLGFDPTSRALASVLGKRIVGVLDTEPASLPPEVPNDGTPERLAEVVAEKKPGHIVVSNGGHGVPVKPRELLRLRYEGISIESGSTFYENVFSRVSTASLAPFDLLFSRDFMANRAAMAVQAVYTNVISLGLLLLLSPVLVFTAILVRVSTGEPALQRVECVGFQQIPFSLFRFRTRDRAGNKFRGSDWIEGLRLVNLPKLINVARGEMTLIGPPPVRAEFAHRLLTLIPVYGHRFTVRPGILGWSQIHLRLPLPDERLRLEYDLYYVKQGTPSMDLDIFLRTVLGVRSSR